MNRYTTCIFLGVIWLVLLFGTSFEMYAQDCVYEPNYENTYLNSSDPNTIEYDNMVSGYNATIARGSDGKVMVWGQSIGPNGENIAPPLELNGDNYGIGEHKLTGSILKFAMGGDVQVQFAVLTTEGLYIWGHYAALVSLNFSNVVHNSFRKVSIGTYNVRQGELKSDGLPQGVEPTAVKMMFGTLFGLAIVTCDGQAWVLSGYNKDKYGDGAEHTAANNILWHRVSTAPDTPLENVVAVRGTYDSFMALTAEGKVYTWGARTYLGDNTGQQSRPFATLMTPIAGVRPKMIGMANAAMAVSYYILGTNGRVYSMGDNTKLQLGDYGYSHRYSWYNVVGRPVTKEGVTFKLEDNIAWISPTEHGGNHSTAVNVLTKEGKLWAWGANPYGMLGEGSDSAIDPTLMPGTGVGAEELKFSDFLTAVETGVYTSIVLKRCFPQFGFVGYSMNGSMGYFGNGTSRPRYHFSNIVKIPLYGAVIPPILPDRKICNGSTFDLNDARPTVLPPGGTGIDWWMDVDETIPVANPEAVTPGTYYGTVRGLEEKCSTAITISVYTASDPEFGTCESHFISNPVVRQLMQNATDATEQRNNLFRAR
ncbi:hypothetical protein [Myroides sp. TSA_177.3]|uniref:hypothetical protein n=1 Tax=Myroides sp. TSA_177.3 TaxID=3415650 RepID=UPI004045EE48